MLDALGPVAAWKVGAITAEQQRAMGLTTPIGAAIPASLVRDASAGPARFSLASLIAPLVECELAFELERDLPARPDKPYSRDEVAAATGCLRIAIELVDPRLPRGSGTLSELADGFNNGAFIAGPRLRDWHSVDLAAVEIALDADGVSFAGGSGRAILGGDAFAAVVLLANAQPPGRGLRAGDVITTGSCTGAPRLPGPGRYRAVFSGLGEVTLQLDP